MMVVENEQGYAITILLRGPTTTPGRFWATGVQVISLASAPYNSVLKCFTGLKKTGNFQKLKSKERRNAPR